MSLRENIKKTARSEALNAVNQMSGTIKNTLQQQANKIGLFTITKVKYDQTSGTITVSVDTGSGITQDCQYVGSKDVYPGLSVFCTNGIAR